MRVRRKLGALRAEQLVEPRVAQTAVRVRRRVRGRDEHLLEPMERDRLLFLVPLHGIELARELALELLAGDHERDADPR